MDYDLIIIGAGPGGATAAEAASHRGLRVALVDDGDLMGYGLRGAYKSKALYEIAREHYVMRRRWELSLERLHADFEKFQRAAEHGARDLRAWHRGEFAAMGVEIVNGRGRLVGPHTVAVGERTLTGRFILIATGTRPRTLPELAPDADCVWTSDEIVSCDRAPTSLVILGAGVIGCEFASIFSALGVHVSLLDSRERILSHEDPDVGAMLARSFEQLGVEILPSVRCSGMEVVDDRVRTHLEDGRVLESDAALLAIGRVANTEGLGLESAGVATNARGFVTVDEDLRTNVPHIYACGDVGIRDTPLDLSLVHVAEAEARRAVGHMCGDRAPLDTTHVPFIIFTLPMVAGAGDNEAVARALYGDVRVGKFANVRNHRAHAKGARSGFVKLITGPEGDDRVLGVRAIGDGVDTLIGEISLMIEHGLPYTYLLDAIHAHPSLSESLHGAALIIAHDAMPYREGEDTCRDYFIEP